jgi:hypothetical protein
MERRTPRCERWNLHDDLLFEKPLRHAEHAEVVCGMKDFERSLVLREAELFNLSFTSPFT